MKAFKLSMLAGAACAMALGGCSSDNSVLGQSLTTSSVDATKTASAKPDPACLALTQRIDALRKDGVTERAAQAAVGNTQTVAVKRDSLAKLSELDRANFDYQTRCSAPGLAKPVAAAPIVTPPAPPAVKPKKTAAVAATAAAPASAPIAIAPPANAAPVAVTIPVPAEPTAPAAAPVGQP